MEDKFKNYRIKEENKRFYPQYYKTMWWHNFSEPIFDEATGWTTKTIYFENLNGANNYIKEYVQKEEEEFQKHLNKMQKLDMKSKFHKVV